MSVCVCVCVCVCVYVCVIWVELAEAGSVRCWS